VTRRIYGYGLRSDDWPDVGDWEAWQHEPVLARQVQSDGWFMTTHVRAGDWIVRVPAEPHDPNDPFPDHGNTRDYLIFSDTEFRRHYRQREDMEIHHEVRPAPAAPLPFKRREG
jgi:hypothetical protein